MAVLATDPKGLPLEYRFYLMRNCGGVGDVQAWSELSDAEYTFVEDDISNCTSIVVGVRNDDGIDFDSTMFGDLQYAINVTVRDEREPPSVGSVTKYKNDQLYEGNEFAPGDTIRLIANATDPAGLPLEYRFYLMRNCGGAGDIQSWSELNEAEYTFVEADISNCTSIIVGVKNNDGIEFDSEMFGDLQYTVNLQVSDGRLPPVVNSVTKYKNGNLYTGNEFQVGDTIRIVVDATDPNSLSLQYRFYLMRNCGGVGDVQSWSVSNEAEHTFVEADITSCTSIIIGVKNNDGIDFDGSMFGDLQSAVNVSVNF
jgi:hypothetical protein